MNMKDQIQKIIASYDPKKIRIGVLGSHSALEVASGARELGFETVVVCQKGREKTYTHYYGNIFDSIAVYTAERLYNVYYILGIPVVYSLVLNNANFLYLLVHIFCTYRYKYED